MDINSIMENLGYIKDLAKDLERETNCIVRVYFFDNGKYWGIRCMDANDDECFYSKNCDSLEALRDHLDTMLVGANLANGKEI